jgi:hypothetical protein
MPRFLPSVFLALVVVLLTGCATSSAPTPSLASVRKVFVQDAQSSGVTEADALADAVHDASVHELAHLGYVATRTSAEAQAILRSSWRVNRSADGRVSLALSQSLFDPAGRRLMTTDSGTALSVNFWNESAVRRAVEQGLARLPKVAPAASAQK